MSKKASYQQEWEEYRGRQKAYWLVFVLYIPSMMILAALAGTSLGSLLPFGTFLFIGFIAFAVLWIGLGIRLQFWKCPKYGRPFIGMFWLRYYFANKIANCRLLRYEGSSFFRGKL